MSVLKHSIKFENKGNKKFYAFLEREISMSNFFWNQEKIILCESFALNEKAWQ